MYPAFAETMYWRAIMYKAVMINLLPDAPIEFQLAFVEILCFMERDGNADLRVLQNLRMGKNRDTKKTAD